MHTVQLLLKTSKYERHEIDRRFRALAHLHNVCVKHARKCMIRLQHDKRYAELRQLYNELVKKEKMATVIGLSSCESDDSLTNEPPAQEYIEIGRAHV